MATTGTLINNTDTEWIGVIHSQAPKFFKGYADETIRNRIVLAYLRKHGRILLNANSPMCVWNVKYDQQPIESAGDAGSLVFNRHDLQRQLAVNWRGYVGTDSASEKEIMMNKGPGQILTRYSETIPSLTEAITDHFSDELFIDGEAAGNTNRIHGLNTFLKFNTGGMAASDLVAAPNATYAGQSCVLGNEGGTWSTDLASADRPNAGLANDWPNGSGPIKYDFVSPLGINWSANSWGTSLQTWEANCERAIRQGIIWQTNRGGQKGRPKLCLLSTDLYTGYANSQISKQRIVVPHKESEDLGFSDTLNQEGVAIRYDYSVPANTGYMLAPEMMELASLDKVLFGYRGPDFSIKDRAWLFYVGFWGNAKYRPKHFAMLKNFKA